MSEKIEKYAIVGGAVATVALVALAVKSNQQSGTVAQPRLNTIIRGVSPETVALRAQKTQTDIAEIGAKTQMFGQFTGLIEKLDTNAVSERVSKIMSDADVQKNKEQAAAAIRAAEISGESLRYTADKQSWAEQQAAYYQYQGTKAQESTKKSASIWGTIGNIATGFLKFI